MKAFTKGLNDNCYPCIVRCEVIKYEASPPFDCVIRSEGVAVLGNFSELFSTRLEVVLSLSKAERDGLLFSTLGLTESNLSKALSALEGIEE